MAILSRISMFLLFACSPAFASIAFVQKATNQVDADPSTSTFAANITAGNFVIATVFFCNDAACASDVSGITAAVTSTSCTFTEAVHNRQRSGVAMDTFVGHNCSGGSKTVTSTLTGETDPHYHILHISEWSGVRTSSAVDQTNKLYTDTGTTITISTTGSTAEDNELIYAFEDGGGTITHGAGYTALNSESEEYDLTNTAGTQTATWSSSGGTILKTIMTIKNAAGGGGSSAAGRQLLLGVGP